LNTDRALSVGYEELDLSSYPFEEYYEGGWHNVLYHPALRIQLFGWFLVEGLTKRDRGLVLRKNRAFEAE